MEKSSIVTIVELAVAVVVAELVIRHFVGATPVVAASGNTGILPPASTNTSTGAATGINGGANPGVPTTTGGGPIAGGLTLPGTGGSSAASPAPAKPLGNFGGSTIGINPLGSGKTGGTTSKPTNYGTVALSKPVFGAG